MSDTMEIHSHKGPYTVRFVEDAFAELARKSDQKLHMIVDANVDRLYRDRLQGIESNFASILKIDATETSKSLEQFPAYIEHLVGNKIRRGHTIVAVGGGIIQDISCFIAATILRGVPWVFVPTTLLAQADSCIGSKSSINSGEIKNILGNFLPPNEILLSVDFLNTLEKADVYSGIGEIIKVHAISGPADFETLAADYHRLIDDPGCLLHYIQRALNIKKKIIEVDEFDQNVRNVMNYGHSFGHAIESATNFEIPHGIAVTIGMDMANTISRGLAIGTEATRLAMHPLLKRNYELHANTKIDADRFFNAIARDKKNQDDRLGLILPGEDGKPARHFVPNDERFQKLCREFLAQGRAN